MSLDAGFESLFTLAKIYKCAIKICGAFWEPRFDQMLLPSRKAQVAAEPSHLAIRRALRSM